jgi:hypothetical protein
MIALAAGVPPVWIGVAGIDTGDRVVPVEVTQLRRGRVRVLGRGGSPRRYLLAAL